MIPLAIISVVLVLTIVLVVAYHLIGIWLHLHRTANALGKLARGLAKVRDDTAPLNGKIDTINAGLGALAPPLRTANGNLAAIVEVASSL